MKSESALVQETRSISGFVYLALLAATGWILYGCGTKDPRQKFRDDPEYAYEIAEKCTSGPGMPRTEYEIRWPGECVAAYDVVEEVFTREFFLKDIQRATERLIDCRITESVSKRALYAPCEAAKAAVLETYALEHFLNNTGDAKREVNRCREGVDRPQMLRYLPEVCANAAEAVYGIRIGPKYYGFSSDADVERHAAELDRALEWAPVRAARERTTR